MICHIKNIYALLIYTQMAYINVTKPENYMPISIPYEYDVMEKYEHIGKCLITYEYIISFHNLDKYIYIYM